MLKYAISGLKPGSSQPPDSPAKMLPDGTWVDTSGATVEGGWPPDWGFVKHRDVAQAALTMVPKGALIDRFGSKYGTFFSQPNVSLRKRSMLPLGEKTKYTVYEVVKPFSALVGIVAPWFGEPGGGVQIMANRSAKELLKSGYIKKVTKKTVSGGQPLKY